ncbi:PRC and DUF2382 domain-containing protein [Almyronema epifaneia]|uniref:PRC and DUF2382 domain-containing protein n=1 Tax=Almyronema epifaneia S1 TaxID=2991925 RepID=A0ABW6ICB2_9CYAN
MALFKIGDRYPNYQNRFFDGNELKGTPVYASAGNQKMGSVHDILIDEVGRIRYLVVDTGFGGGGKKVLLPIGRCLDDPERDRLYATDLTPQQVENLPEYDDQQVVDDGYEERVRTVYCMSNVEQSAAVEETVAVEQAGVKGYLATPPLNPSAGAKAEVYEPAPDLYAMNETHHRLRLYEERLVTHKSRHKAGEVTIAKRIATEPAEATVPVQKEKVVIEVNSVDDRDRVATTDAPFEDTAIPEMAVYEEAADIHKETVVHQQVNVRKEVKTDKVTTRETLHREALDVKQSGHPQVIERRSSPNSSSE